MLLRNISEKMYKVLSYVKKIKAEYSLQKGSLILLNDKKSYKEYAEAHAKSQMFLLIA